MTSVGVAQLQRERWRQVCSKWWCASVLLCLLYACWVYGEDTCSIDAAETGDTSCGDSRNTWYIDKLAVEGPCNIDTVDATSLSQKDFVSKYAFSSPVIINLLPGWNSVFRSNCEKDVMLEKYGNKKIRLSSANTHSYKKRDVTLRYYMENILKPQDINTLGNETFYWFGDNNYTEWEDLFNLYKRPPVSLPNSQGSYSFGMAGAGTGVPFHWHGPGFGEVVFGRKRWFLFPPDRTPLFNPDRTTLYWLMNEYSKLSPEDMPLECTLKPGQAGTQSVEDELPSYFR